METAVKTLEKKKLGQLLLEAKLVTEEQLEEALAKQKGTKRKLGEVLTDAGFCSELEVAEAISTQLGIQLIDLQNIAVEPAALDIISEKMAKKHLIMPTSVEGRKLYVAMADPMSYEAFDDVSFASGFSMKPFVATKSDILWAIEQHYHIGTSIENIMDGCVTERPVELVSEITCVDKEIAGLKKKSGMAPTIQMVNLIISNAIDQKASDIHLEPLKDKVLIRNRVDGMLRINLDLPKWTQGTLTSRIKIMSKMDISEKRKPQDGRIGVRICDRVLDLRVSTLPTKYGEKVVLRILDPEQAALSVEELGLKGKALEEFCKLISLPQGIILVTGPTGSGKTTTLYSALIARQSPEINIVTVEEPIEYDLDGINQVAVNEKVQLTFANALRSILRQDPDVVMIGEMRDMETATISMQASLTGQLVFSTIHTNNSVSTITRLMNFGVPPYMIASSIIGIISQRLARVICPECKTRDHPDEESLLRIGISKEQAKDLKFYRGEGCSRCGNTGYRGRTGIYEMLLLTRKIKELIAGKVNESIIKQAAIAQGMDTLAQAGLEKIIAGITTVEEVIRVVQTDEDFGSLCPGCNYILAAEFVTCPQCGKNLLEACPDCHKTVNSAWNFCPYCTKKLNRV